MKKIEKKYIEKAVSFGCIVCGRPGEWHHARIVGAGGKKAPNLLGFCLCPDHHRNGGAGVAIHASQLMFEGNFGSETELINKTILRVTGDLI